MMISIDAYGMVVITSVVKVLFVYKVTRHEVINPLTSLFPQFFTMSARFKSVVQEQTGNFDHVPLFAVGCRDLV